MWINFAIQGGYFVLCVTGLHGWSTQTSNYLEDKMVDLEESRHGWKLLSLGFGVQILKHAETWQFFKISAKKTKPNKEHVASAATQKRLRKKPCL